MRNCVLGVLIVALLLLPLTIMADPIPGTYTSALRPGATSGVLVGRASISRQYPNSGNPKVFHAQSWDATTLGTQWEIRCGIETTSTAPDSSLYNTTTGTGVITYHQTFQGGTFSLYPDATLAWGSGSGTLATTSIVTQVQFVSFYPFSSSFTGTTSGTFDIGCTLTFAMGNGYGAGETSDPPYLTKPATYPAFLGTNCAEAANPYGSWGDVNDIIININADCTVPTEHPTWGAIKTLYR